MKGLTAVARKSRKSYISQPTIIYNTAIYLRLSVADGSDSLQNQQHLLQSYITQCPQLTLQKIFTDNGKAGTNFNRPAWRALIRECERGSINCIVTKDLSRLGRNYIEVGDYIERVLPTLGVRLIAVNDGYDSLNINNSGRLIFNIKNLVNDIYAKDISRKVLATIRAKQARGQFVGSRAPHGYSLGPDSRLIINPDTAPVVRRIFEMKATGHSGAVICSILNAENIPCPNKYRCLTGLARSGKYANTLWSGSTVAGILQNPVYVGDPAIIPRELFNRASGTL